MTRDDIIRLSLMGERTIKQRIEWAVNMEREECAKIVEQPWQGHFREVAAQIRARLAQLEPQREWVGLNDEELEFYTEELGQGELGRGVLRAVVDFLKEKNT